jgi:NADH-ubiquinone oxidoreductase chain 6
MVYVLEILILATSILVITNTNPIISILYLIALFLSVSIYLIIVNIIFLGLSYLLVYIGAVSILFLFILMLIDIRISELQEKNNNSIFLGIVLGIILLNIFNIYNNNKNTLINNKYISDSIFNNIFTYYKDNINYISYNNWNNSINEDYDLVSIGNIIYTSHSIFIILALLILLLAMVGAIKINIK